jgi:hypothetical protein
MTVFEAITDMRQISKEGGEFSFSFMSYSLMKRTSDGPTFISRARLCKQSREDKKEQADNMLNFIDLDRGQFRHCYQPLLMTYKGNLLTL